MKGEYRLFRQGGGRGAFAHVLVELLARDGLDEQVAVDVDPTDAESARPTDEKELFDVAKLACQECMCEVANLGYDTKPWRVVVRKLLMSVADTRQDAVFAAAFLATAKAFGAEGHFHLTFQNKWRVASTSK